jgi:hypothetical protein
VSAFEDLLFHLLAGLLGEQALYHHIPVLVQERLSRAAHTGKK